MTLFAAGMEHDIAECEGWLVVNSVFADLGPDLSGEVEETSLPLWLCQCCAITVAVMRTSLVLVATALSW